MMLEGGVLPMVVLAVFSWIIVDGCMVLICYSGGFVGDPMVNFPNFVRIIAFLLSEVENSYFC